MISYMNLYSKIIYGFINMNSYAKLMKHEFFYEFIYM